MPQNRRRKPRKNPDNRASNTRRTPPALSLSKGERQEMTGYDRETKISLLSSRQQGALPVLAAAPTIAQAARDCRVSESTLRRWLREPAFAEELGLLRQQYADQVGQQCLGLILRGMNVLAEAMDDPDRSLRLRATRYAMSFAAHLHGSMKLNADIREMRDSLDSVLSGQYINQPEPEKEQELRS
ncbi:MAG: hypothetical protein F4X66_17830 [Chloroflexi bacterium]|nr:hypothetical protein [Chloroflexota bacterium]